MAARRHNRLAGAALRIRRQRGVALAVALILLLVMTLLSVAGLRGTGMQERMASNLRDRNLAFQSAESALRAAETALVAGGGAGSPAVSAPGDLGWWEACWEGSVTGCPPAVVHPVDTAAWGIAAAPEYRLERLRAGNYGSLAADEALSSPPLYRITVRAVGGTADSVVLLQSTFRP
ncbi:PilX N-terminal domain-containing pilus assembly protein [uncultured Thiohalocapsa sp.]|uniref:pilus assembly PilX family protein n=1 Tax=uncultured Thiohalocapsa sp. TaxID=768990 RepID=UPI0025E1DC37|nr:PilX N-terminal domain-containing pilus assembly protein [uncultured Thiohalocapsa sp.]